MKNQFIIFMFLALVISSCGVDEVVLPVEKSCQLTTYNSNRTIPTEFTQENTITNYKDSIVSMLTSGTAQYRYVYKFNNNKIDFVYTNTTSNMVTNHGTYYLNGAGLIDSIVRTSGFTDAINYRASYTRNASNQVTAQLVSYITYGYDSKYTYNADGTIAYEIHQGQGTQSHQNDSILYTYDMTKPDNGSPQYILHELEGKRSAYHITGKSYIDRTSQDMRRENRYTVGPLDGNGNLTTIRYQIDNSPGIEFDASYSYDRVYAYDCN